MVNSIRAIQFGINLPSANRVNDYLRGLTRATQTQTFQSTASTITAKEAINFPQIAKGFKKSLEQAGQIAFHQVGELTEAVKQVSAKAQTAAKYAQEKRKVENALAIAADPFASLESPLSAILKTSSYAVKLLTLDPPERLTKIMMPLLNQTHRQGLTLA